MTEQPKYFLASDTHRLFEEDKTKGIGITITASTGTNQDLVKLTELIILSLEQNTILDNIKVTVR